MALVLKKIIKENLLIIVALVGLAIAGLAIAQSGGGGASAGDLTKGLVGHWPLDGAHYNPSTDRVSDISGYQNHGTNYGATFAEDRFGKQGGAMSFSGGNRIEAPFGNNYDVGNHSLTLSIWVKPNTTSGSQMFAAFGTSTDGRRAYFAKYNGKWDMGIRTNAWGSGQHNVTTDWTHITIVFNGDLNSAIMYVDSEYSIQKSYTDYQLLADLKMGVYGNNGYPWDGLIDDVRIYDRALSEDEIKLLYESYQPQASVGSSNKGLASHYTFDDFSEYTENLVPYADYSNRNYGQAHTASSWGGDAATVYYYENGGYNNLPYKKLVKTSSGTGGTYLDDNRFIDIEDNKTYVISAWMKANREQVFNGHLLNINRYNDNTYRLGSEITLTTEWERYSWTYSSGSGHAGEYQSRHIIYIDDDLPLEVYWSGFQVEEKPCATPFIDGTREDLVKDNSGYDSHALLDSDTPKYLEEDDSRQGIYEFFKGEEKRIKLPDPYLDTKTISFWAKVKEGEHISSERVPFLVYNDGVITGSGDTRQILLCMQDNKFRMHGWGTLDPSASSNINDGEWHHLVWHMNHHATDANQRLMNMWVDGTKEVADFNYSQGSFGPVADSFWWVGYNSRSYSSYLRDAGILIDDLRFYDRKLSDEEVSLLYAKGQVGSSTELSSGSLNKGLVLDMPLNSTWLKDETPGSEIMADRAPYGNHGQNYGATITTDGTDFDGTTASHYINLGNSITGLDNAFSVDFWIYFRRGLRYGTLPETLAGIVHNLNGNSAGYLGLNYNKAYYDLNFEGGRISGYTSTFSDIRNEWHKFSFVFDKNYIYFYKDGEKFDQIEENTSFLSGSNSVRLGYFTTYWLDGVISDFKIYNRALSADEVKLLYDKGR